MAGGVETDEVERTVAIDIGEGDIIAESERGLSGRGGDGERGRGAREPGSGLTGGIGEDEIDTAVAIDVTGGEGGGGATTGGCGESGE